MFPTQLFSIDYFCKLKHTLRYSDSDAHSQAVSGKALRDTLDLVYPPVLSPTAVSRHLQNLVVFLYAHQAAASRYAIPTDNRTLSFWRLAQYYPLDKLFAISKQKEP